MIAIVSRQKLYQMNKLEKLTKENKELRVTLKQGREAFDLLQKAFKVGVMWTFKEKDDLRARIDMLKNALEKIAELENDCENQQFKLTRFQTSQISREALNRLNNMN